MTTELARLGDSIECDLHSWPFKLVERLVTPQSVAYANHLLLSNSGWRLSPSPRSEGANSNG
jgi:hypothetical protein